MLSPWYFPGDPPVPDMLLHFGTLVAVTGLLALVFGSVLGGRIGRFTKRNGFGIVALGLFISLPGLVVVGYRHTSDWEPARSAIREYDRAIGAAVEEYGWSQPVSHEQFELLKARFLPDPQVIHLSGLERPVHLRMMSGSAPFVGLDYGGGPNAVFEPVAMKCIYSD